MKDKLKQIIEELQKILDSIDNKEKKPFKPTEEQLERWKKTKPTEKTKKLLIKKGIPEKEVEEIKTQYECSVILNNLKPENI